MKAASDRPPWPAGDGEMAGLIRTFDWTATPLGPIDDWPQSLRSAVDLCLGSAVASYVWWGPELIQFYNDAALLINRAKHPAFLGKPAREAWADVWQEVGGLFGQVVATGASVRGDDLPMVPDRGGPREAAWFTFSYGPCRDEAGAVAGVFCTAIETTARVRAEQALRESEARQAFLLNLTDALRPLADPDAIKAAVSEEVGPYFDVGRCGYAEIPPPHDHLVVARDWTNGVMPSLQDVWPLASFGETIIAQYRRGQTVVVEDVLHDDRVRGYEAGAVAAGRVRSSISVQLLKGGQWVASFYVQDTSARHWTPSEIDLMEDIAERTWAAVERARAEAARRASEARYRTLFTSIDEGFCVVEVTRDDAGEIRDIVFREVNQAFERQTGLADVVGKTVRELMPAVEEYWVEIYRRVTQTGEAVRTENYVRDLDRWYNVHFSCVGGEGSRLVAVVFDDVSARKRAELALRASQERQAFLLRLSDALRPLTDPIAIQETASRLTSEHLDVGRVIYAEIRHEPDLTVVVERDWPRRGLPSVVGRYRMDDFGTFLAEEFAAGRAVIVADAANDPRISPIDCANWNAVGVAAACATPLMKAERFVAYLAAQDDRPRPWMEEEVALLLEVAERIWAAVERARAEAALRESERRMRRTLSVPKVGVLYFDLAGHMHEVNAAFQQMSGYTTEELRATTHWDRLTAPEFHTLTAQRARDLAERGETPPYEKQMIRKDGTRWWGLFTPTRLSGSGPASECVEFVIDITETKCAQDALRESEARFRALAETAPLGVGVSSADGTIVYTNHAYATILGYEDGELVGQPTTAVYAGPADRAARPADLPEQGPLRDHEVRLRRKDGSPVWVSINVAPIEFDSQQAIIGVVQDVTERKRAEAALRASEERYRTLFESIDEGFCLIEPVLDDGAIQALVFRDVNPTFERHTGLSNIIGKTVGEVLPSFEAYWIERCQHVLRTGEAVREENYVRDVDRWFNAHFSRVGGTDSRFVTVVFDDVTERRRIEVALRDSEASLQRRVAAATAALRTLSRRLLQVQEDERRFLARELHDEIGQVLTGLGFQLAAAAATNETALADVQATVQALTEHVRQLSMDLRPAVLDRFGLLAALQWQIERYQQRTGIAVDLRHAGLDRRFPPEVEIGAFRIVQEALTNVARHAHVDRASVQLFADDRDLTVVVRDQGQGFDLAQEPTTSGLGGMRERVELLGGTLAIESTPGDGTAVTAEIPLDRQAELTADDAPGPEAAP